jgi:predicted RNase H-like nuclease (RuvC/YqgF family)
MDTLERQIRYLNEKIKTSEEVINNLQEALGEIAFADDADKKTVSMAADLLKEIEAIDKTISDEHNRIEEILNAVERADEIEALRKSLNERIRSIEKDNVSNYETIGRAGYEAFNNGELPAERYAEFFDEVVKLKLQIEEIELEKERLEKSINSQNLFYKIKIQAKLLYLKNSAFGHYRTLQKNYKRSGENLCHSELVMNLEAESVEKAMEPFKENLAGLEKLEKESIALSSENEQLKGSLEGLGAGGNAVRTVSQIEKDVNDNYTQRKIKLREAGELLYLNKKDPAVKTKNAKSLIKDLDKELNSISEYQNEITRCESEIEIERQNKEIETLNKKINGYEEKIQNYSQEADHLKQRINSAVKDIKKLEETGTPEEEVKSEEEVND